MAFPDNSTYMEFGDDAHLFEEHNSGTFDFQHMAADNTAFTPAQPTTIRGLVQQDRSKQPSYLSSLNRSSNNQGRGTGLSTRTAPTGHPSGDLSSLESTLKRVRPLQSDTRLQALENRMQHYEDHVRRMEAKHKSLNDAVMDINKVVRNSDSQISEACKAAHILTAIMQKMFPTDDTNATEAEQM